MSDNASDLLLYGVAAAKANSRDEARNYLEWVLRTDADFDQQAEAWYWLSRITDDPKEKRDCLENVLAITPRHPEAQRDMAILEGRLKPETMHDPLHSVAPLAPGPTVGQSDLQTYKCPQCGARMTARETDGKLVCGFCGYEAGGSKNSTLNPSAVDEQDWVAAIYSMKGHRWEVPTERAFKCNACGATVVMPPSNVSTNCPFCGTPYVAQSSQEQELIEPNGILPFAFDEKMAWACVVKWLGTQRFAPADLGHQAMQNSPRPIYVPFWTFDIDGEIGWRGWEVSTEFGRATRAPASGSAPIYFDDLLVPGTHSLPAHLLSALQFDTKHLLPYSIDMLANWPAEVYAVSVADASLVARDHAIHSRQTQDFINTTVSINGNIQDLIVETPDLSVLSYKLALLPVWVGSYIYGGKTFAVLVNGQSGVVEGEVPRNRMQQVLGELFGVVFG